MSMSFFPSYLRSWVTAERSPLEYADDTIDILNIREQLDEGDEDWVIIEYDKDETQEKDELDDLLQQYVLIQSKSEEKKIKPLKKTKKLKKHGKTWKPTYVLALNDHKYISNQFTPSHLLPNLKKNRNNNFQDSSPPQTAMKTVEGCIVPYDVTNHQNKCSTVDVLKILQQMTERTSTVIIPCDLPVSNNAPSFLHIGSVCVRYRNPRARSFYVIDNIDNNSPILSVTSDLLNRNKSMDNRLMLLPVENDCSRMSFEDLRLDDMNESSFEKRCAQSIYNQLSFTKIKFENMLRSIVMLHLLVNKEMKMKLWSTSQSAKIPVIPVKNTMKKLIPDMKPPRHTDMVQVSSKEMRRKNYRMPKNNMNMSNRQRGMKNGRFQNNVGRRETWRSH